MREISGEGYSTISSVHSVLQYWEIEKTWNYSGSVCLIKLSNRAKRTLVREVTKNPMTTDRTTDGRTCQKDNSLYSTSPVWAEWESCQTEATPEKKGT
jgi:hypothetical protein